jgi:hypothetical protein
MDNLQEKIVFFRDGEEVSIYEKNNILYPMGINIIFELALQSSTSCFTFTELRSQPTVHEKH